MKIHEILSAEPDRWCQDTFSQLTPDGRYAHCLSEWMMQLHPSAMPEVNRLHAAIREQEPDQSIIGWNDKMGRTVAEVIELCRKADV